MLYIPPSLHRAHTEPIQSPSRAHHRAHHRAHLIFVGKLHILCHIIKNSKMVTYLRITNDMSISPAKQNGLCGGLCGGLCMGSVWALCGLCDFLGFWTHRLFQLMPARCILELLGLDPTHPPPCTFTCVSRFNSSRSFLDIPSTLYLQPLRFTPRHALHLVPSASQTHSSTSMRTNAHAP